MKRTIKVFLTTALILSVALAGIVVARGWNNNWQGRGMGPGDVPYHYGMGPGPHKNFRGMGPGNYQNRRGMQQGKFQQPWKMLGPGALLRDEMIQAQAETLAEITGQTPAAIQAQMKTKPFRLLLSEYQVDLDELEIKMHAKVLGLVKQAVTDGKLTQEQADIIYQRMDWMSRQSPASRAPWGY